MDKEERSFEDFLARFFTRKRNLLRQSNATPVKRTQVVTLDLGSQPLIGGSGNNTSTLDGKLLYKIPANFTGFHVEKFYNTIDNSIQSGELFLVPDDPSNSPNSKLLQSGDSCDLVSAQIANGWLYWVTQPNISVRITFFIDMDYRAGSSKVNVFGTINTFYPTLVSPDTGIPGALPLLAVGSGFSNVTIPAGFQARVSVELKTRDGFDAVFEINPPGGSGYTIVLTTDVPGSNTSNINVTMPSMFFNSGYQLQVRVTGTPANTCRAFALVEFYKIS